MNWIETPLGSNYQRSDALGEFLKGKSVACVGPAPQNTGTGLGKTIDSYDIVVRLGDFLRGDNISEDYGSRTDILVHSFNEHDMPSFTEECFEDMRKCKFLICSQVSANLLHRQEDFFNAIGTQWHIVNDEVFDGTDGLRTHLSTTYGFDNVLPNTGFNGILTMLEYDITELFVTGMTFYDMGKWEKSYHDDWYTAGGSSRKFKSYGLNECREHHKQLPQIKHFQEICTKYKDKIKLDQYLTDHLWSI